VIPVYTESEMFEKPTVKRFYVENYPYFVTTATYKKKPLFVDTKKAEILKNVIYNFRSHKRYLVLSFVIMPDHLHLLLVPAKNYDISKIMHTIKRGSARLINQELKSSGKVWEPRFFDRVARSKQELINDITYIHFNPVEKGLVEKPEEFLFSSANPRFENDLEEYFNGRPPDR